MTTRDTVYADLEKAKAFIIQQAHEFVAFTHAAQPVFTKILASQAEVEDIAATVSPKYQKLLDTSFQGLAVLASVNTDAGNVVDGNFVNVTVDKQLIADAKEAAAMVVAFQPAKPMVPVNVPAVVTPPPTPTS